MTGAIAGDIIASPYRRNPLPDSGSIFFPLFASSEKVEVDAARGRASSRSFRAAPTQMTDLSLRSARWFLQTGRTVQDWADLSPDRNGPELLAVCVPLSELAGSPDAALSSVSTVLAASGAPDGIREGASALVRILSAIDSKASPEELREILREVGYDPDRSPSEMRPFLSGTVVMTAPGKLGIGDGKPVRDPSLVIPGALAAVLGSESWEESVRRATAMAGDPCLTAFLAGAMAQRRYGMPDGIASEALAFIGQQDRILVESVDRSLMRAKAAERGTERRQEVRRKENEGKRFGVIRMDGRQSVYLIPEGAHDIEDAVRAAARRTKMPYETAHPSDKDEVLRRLSVQADMSGNPLDGTYAEHPRPEVKTLWLQEGRLRTSTTRTGTDAAGRPLPSPERRAALFNEFKQLRDYAEGVRDELERLSCADPPEGMHVHFASAFYPVVLERTIDLMQGDILRGRVGIDDDGRIRVDTSALTGGVHTEGLEGVLATMDIFHKNDTPADIMAALDRWCLDRGAIEDEQDRTALKEGGEEAEGVRLRFRSNINTAVNDLCSVPGDLKVAVIPDASPRMAVAEAVRLETAERSRERYDGLTREEVVWSRSHPGSVFTIGHSNLQASEFEALLRKFGIQLVVDIRSYPRSRYSPQFNADILGRRLEGELGIGYQQAGNAFGGHVYEGHGEQRRRLNYDETMARPEFGRYLRALRECVREGTRVALMCSESDPLDCHRFAMVGYALAHPSDGRVKAVDVQHITRGGYLLSQDYLERKVVRDCGLSDSPGGLAEAMRCKGEALIARNRDSMAISLTRNMRERKEAGRNSGPKRRH